MDKRTHERTNPIPLRYSRAKGRPNSQDFLRSILSDGPLTVSEILRLGREAGIGKTTLYKASKVLDLICVIKGFGSEKAAFWELPEEEDCTTISPIVHKPKPPLVRSTLPKKSASPAFREVVPDPDDYSCPICGRDDPHDHD